MSLNNIKLSVYCDVLVKYLPFLLQKFEVFEEK